MDLQRFFSSAGVSIGLLLALVACASNPRSDALEDSLAADPLLQNSPAVESSPNPRDRIALPDDFPAEIPRYPEAELQSVKLPAENASDELVETRWTSGDAVSLVYAFYREQFEEDSWQVLERPEDEAGGTFVVQQDDLNLEVTIEAVAASESAPAEGETGEAAAEEADARAARTNLTLRYRQGEDSVANALPQPGDEDFVGPVVPEEWVSKAAEELGLDPDAPTSFSDLAQVPQELRPAVKEVAKLGVLSPGATANKTDEKLKFEPNKPVARRDYARWLVVANNRFYRSQPSKQIRLGVETATPAFQDVPRSADAFPAIQGLAEAGIIPSPLSGDSTAVLFQPGAPLTREQLVLWKVPLDTRQALPKATLETVQQTWGFQDSSRINPRALGAVLADFQNGEQSNIRRVFGFTTLFQPQKPVTRAEAAAALWYFGTQGEGRSAQEVLQAAEGTE